MEALRTVCISASWANLGQHAAIFGVLAHSTIAIARRIDAIIYNHSQKNAAQV